ncbi:beta-N-acetylglucosaminidase/beta-glucosidase (3-beta-N-acetyl-D-glucosaminidase/beta-D-glucosidase)(Nag3) [Streptococcus suis]|nr:beta-N-acetylglucosaminidase/beta-glucosidase (3-beta-N-acetyl-D-glucosaminidase/beta-D-glucosidase)(Nag3) [Streptococcus suis]
MPRLVDLRKKPYCLNDEQIAWVEDTLANLTDEEKIGQLFVNLFFFGGDAFSGNNLSNQELMNRYHIGGARYMNGSPEQVQGLINERRNLYFLRCSIGSQSGSSYSLPSRSRICA